MEEAENNMRQNVKKYATTVSGALSSNAKGFNSNLAGINLDGLGGLS